MGSFVRFKRILLERERKEEFLEDCSNYIDKNRKKLKKGLGLVRGTKTEYEKNIIQKEYRERREVKGQLINTYLYEKFKPDSFPSRERTVPCFYDSELKESWKGNLRDAYFVFPIGSKFKLVYTEDVKDLNTENPYFYDMANPRLFLRSIKFHLRDNSSDSEFLEELNDIIFHTRSRNYDDIMKNYNFMLDYIRKNKDKIRPILDNSEYHEIDDYRDWKRKWEKTKEKVETFFNNTHSTKKLPSQKGLEVNLFPPDGFYYVKPSIFDDLFR